MRVFRIVAALMLLASPALAQVTPGTSPLSIAKGGTAGATAAAARTNLGVTATGADTTYNFRANNLSDVASASTARTNLGLAIGSNVEAWDNDLDCLAALSSTGVIKRTGAGTCSAGTVALSDLATGTQDTVIGYFGSTASSAIAINNCANALTYSTATHTFGCNVGAGTGTVTTAGVGLTLTGGGTTLGLSTARQTQPTIQKFLSGSGTYTTPANVLSIKITMAGGGGGGEGSGTTHGNGGTGGATCWNTTGAACTTPVYQASGGGGATSTTGGTGGSTTGSGTCDMAIQGGGGNSSAGAFATSAGGGGGNGYLGGGGSGGAPGVGGVAGSANTGGGGGGASANGTAGPGAGGGAAATCIVRINAPAATYTYATGAAGTAGTAGTSGFVGGAGGTSGIWVEEFYN